MKLIKFDTLYPENYVKNKTIESQKEIQKMNFLDFHNWVISLRMNFSDFYTYNLSLNGWESKEFFLGNNTYLNKCEFFYFGFKKYWIKLFHKFRNRLSHEKVPFTEKLIQKIIEEEKPDVIFIREQSTIRSIFWEQFRSNKLVVSRMCCGLPPNWTPLSFDLIYTDIPSYTDFFKANGIRTLPSFNGFDSRILNEVNCREKIYDVTFVGGLGNYYGFAERSKFFEQLLLESGGKFEFNWWGYKTDNFDNDYPALSKRYMGSTAGLEMFEIYGKSKIVLNDYGFVANGNAVNMRIYEVLGIGTLLLTRNSDNLRNWNQFLVTYDDVGDCLTKIDYYLKNNFEREEIAKKGQNHIIQNFNYQDLMSKLSSELIQEYNRKFGTSSTL